MRCNFPQKLVITPLLEPSEQLSTGAAAVDLRLGQEMMTADPAVLGSLDPLEDQRETLTGYLRRTYLPLGGEFILHPRQFALAATLEYIRLPRGLAGHVVGRSRWARVGLIIAMATFVHPGYAGCLTLELQNLGDIPMRLCPGFAVAQLILENVTWEAELDPGQLTCAVGPTFLDLLSEDERRKLRELRRKHKVVTGDGDDAWLDLLKYEERLAQRAVALKPDDATAHYNWGVALGNLGRYEDAVAAYDRVIALNPDDAVAHYNRACAHARLGERAKALADLTRAIQLDPKYREMAKTDEDFASLRDDPEFRNLLGLDEETEDQASA